MRTFRLNEIINKHGQPIYNLSNDDTLSDYQRYRDSDLFSVKNKEYIINLEINPLTCVVLYNSSTHNEMSGYYLMIFDDNQELIKNTFPECLMNDNTYQSVEEVMHDLGYID